MGLNIICAHYAFIINLETPTHGSFYYKVQMESILYNKISTRHLNNLNHIIYHIRVATRTLFKGIPSPFLLQDRLLLNQESYLQYELEKLQMGIHIIAMRVTRVDEDIGMQFVVLATATGNVVETNQTARYLK